MPFESERQLECHHFLLETISSVENQIYRDWELILIDDHSTDASYEIVAQKAKESEKIMLFKNAEGKKGEVSLNFDIFSSGQKVGKGNKKMLLGGLMPYDQLKIDGLVDEYNIVKTEYLAAHPN